MRSELVRAGLWDFDRLCQPWIPEEVLKEAVGPDIDEVLGKYLLAAGERRYKFREAWASERALSAIAAPADSPVWLVAVRPIPLCRASAARCC